MEKMICKSCGEEFKVSYLCRKKGRKFCSLKCVYGNRSKDGGNRIVLKCVGCNKTFEVTPSNKKKYCSMECKRIQREKLKQKKVLCECGCGQEFVYLNKWGHPRRFIQGHVNIWNKGLTKEIDIRVTKRNRENYRLSKLREKNPMFGKSKELSPTWQGGKSFEPYGLEFNNKLKEQIRKRDNYVCQECGKLQSQLKRKLDVHHIDYNKQNNSIFNLISLCKKCHMKTNFNRKHWTDYFKMKIFLKEFFNPQNIKVFNENRKLIAMERLR